MDTADNTKPRGPSWWGFAIVVPLVALVTIVVDRQLSGLGHDHHGEDGHSEHGEAHAGDEHGEEKGGDHDEHGLGRVKLTDEGRKNAGIEVKQAALGTVNVTLALPGEVELNADALAHVTPRVEGTVRDVRKKLGDVVNKGDVLATLDSKELAQLSGQARAAQEKLKLAKATFDRVDKLHKEQIVPEKDHLAAKQAMAEAKIEVESTSQMLASAGSGSSGQYSLVAPIAGTIIEKHASVGEVLKNDTRVFVIADLSSVWVDVTVYAKDLAKVSVGQSVVVRADGIEKPLFGQISFVGAIAKLGARAAQARVVLDNPEGRLKPGLFVSAEVALAEVEAGVVVPDDAVQNLHGTPVVFVEEDGQFEARKVRIGRVGVRTSDARVVLEVLAGLSAGEPYVDKGSFLLKAELGKGAASHDH